MALNAAFEGRGLRELRRLPLLSRYLPSSETDNHYSLIPLSMCEILFETQEVQTVKVGGSVTSIPELSFSSLAKTKYGTKVKLQLQETIKKRYNL